MYLCTYQKNQTKTVVLVWLTSHLAQDWMCVGRQCFLFPSIEIHGFIKGKLPEKSLCEILSTRFPPTLIPKKSGSILCKSRPFRIFQQRKISNLKGEIFLPSMWFLHKPRVRTCKYVQSLKNIFLDLLEEEKAKASLFWILCNWRSSGK